MVLWGSNHLLCLFQIIGINSKYYKYGCFTGVTSPFTENINIYIWHILVYIWTHCAYQLYYYMYQSKNIFNTMWEIYSIYLSFLIFLEMINVNYSHIICYENDDLCKCATYWVVHHLWHFMHFIQWEQNNDALS